MIYVAHRVLKEEVLRRVRHKHEAAGKQVEEDAAQTEYVGLVAVAAFREDLGGDVARGAAFVRQEFVFGSEGREAHIRDSYLVVGLFFNRLNKDVVRLDIPVDDLLLLKEVHCKQTLLHDDPDLGLRELLLLE
jgi:hypothetical protein